MRLPISRALKTLLPWLVLVAVLGAVLAYAALSGPYGLRGPLPWEDEASYLHSQISTCLDSKEYRRDFWRNDCYRALGERMDERYGIEATLSALSAIQDDPRVRTQCHAFGHVLGQREFSHSGSLAQSFLTCSKHIACGEGCFHGAVESYLEEYGGSITQASIAAACTMETNQVTHSACVHGLGHAAMLERGGDAYKALSVCDYLADASDREQCYSGVFMEDVFSFNTPRPSLLRPEDPSYPCEDVAPAYRAQCYESRASFVIQASGNNFGAAAAFCEQVPAAYRSACFSAFGGQAVLLSPGPSLPASVCGAITRTEDRAACLEQAIIFRGHGTAGDPGSFAQLCAAVGEGDRAACIGFMGVEIERWHTGERDALCRQQYPQEDDRYRACAGLP